jgi:chromosome segregation ATPase
MKPIRIVAALTAVLLAAGLLAACGGDDGTSKEDYAQEVEDVLEPLGTELSKLGQTISESEDSAALAAGISEAQGELDQAAADLEEIDPPSDLEDVNADLVAAISEFSDNLGAARDAAEADDKEALRSAITDLPVQAQEFSAKLGEIRQRAIDAGVPIEDDGTSSDETSSGE